MTKSTLREAVEALNSFLTNNSGATLVAIDNIGKKKSDKRQAFFKPYASKSDIFFKPASVISAPVCLTALALEAALMAVFFAVKPIVDLIRKKPSDALESLGLSLTFLVLAVGALLTAVLSPFINLVDAIGSGFARSPKQNNPAQEPAIMGATI